MSMFALILRHAKFSEINKAFGVHNPLEYAAKKGNVAAIRLLIDSGIDINSIDFSTLTQRQINYLNQTYTEYY
jgi:ankyrin repeat protein